MLLVVTPLLVGPQPSPAVLPVSMTVIEAQHAMQVGKPVHNQQQELQAKHTIDQYVRAYYQKFGHMPPGLTK